MTINVPIALLRIGHNALGAIPSRYTLDKVQIGMLWHLIDWQRVYRIVRNLQGRIVKAVQERKTQLRKSLQRLLTNSTSTKLLAIRKVTENKGGRSPGIDGVLWDSPKRKWQALSELVTRGYNAQAVRQVKIPKKNGKWRKLGIPTMKDRAIQALYLMALDPISETLADGHSYGFRPYRSCADAIEQCHIVLSKANSPQWILEADIRGCFDHISHSWLLDNIPLPKLILQTWLKAGLINQNYQYQPTEEGTPQGAIISPTLANMTLDGLQGQLYKAMKVTYRRNGMVGHNPHQINFIRYADDFIVTANNPTVLTEQVKPLLTQFLQQRGLALSEEKTHLTHIQQGFDFLGKTIRKYNGTLLTQPSKKSVNRFLTNVKTLIKTYPSLNAAKLIQLLNPKIKGWGMYYRSNASKETFHKVDHQIWQMIWNACVRKHPKKGKRWVKQKYFTTLRNDHWTFYDYDENGNKVYLMKLGKIPIRRHIKIRSAVNPYDPSDEPYFEQRIQQQLVLKQHGKMLFRQIYNRQNGRCPKCGQLINGTNGWHIHHITPRHLGGKTSLENLMLLHPVCHQQIHYAPTFS